MDRNTWNSIIGFTLIFVIIFVWAKLNSPSPEELRRLQAEKDSLARVESDVALVPEQPARQIDPLVDSLVEPPLADSVLLAGRAREYGPFARASIGEEKEFVLENQKVRIVFSNRGGRIREVLLKDHEKVAHEIGKKEDIRAPLRLQQDERNRFDYLLPWAGGTLPSGDLFFQTEASANSLVFTLQGEGGYLFRQEYRLAEDDFELSYVISHQGFDLQARPLQLEWKNYLDRLERNHEYERIFSTVYYKPANSDPDYCSCRSSDEQILNKPVKWVSHANQFFNSTLISATPFASGEMRTEMAEVEDPWLKMAYSKLQFPAIPAGSAFPMTLFVGPNDYTRLRAYGENVEDIIPFGWSLFGSINRHVVRPIFTFLSSFILNKGLVILLLTLLVKMVLYPLTYKMLLSQAKMGALKPKLAHLKEKFKDDAQQIQIETMKIYREFGVNPLGGCMPMLLQMPIWIALYRFFPASIEFRQEGFLWADDLSSYDAFIQLSFAVPFYGDHISLFTLIWVITTIIYTYYSTREMDMSINPAMKYVQYAMPVMFLFWFNNYASGLTAYMCISNILNIGQTLVTKNYIINHEKIRAQLEANKLKPKKKSSFQERLETALREQQKKQSDREGGQKKGKK
jgi:YidC/Oxa1 family membrane protein insertase